MRKTLLVSVVALMLFATVLTAAAFGPNPSWDLTQGAANSCTSQGGFVMLGVEVNIAGSASEQGVLSAPGYPNLGFTIDSNYGPDYGTLPSFFVFANAPYSLAPNTILTLTVTTYNSINFTGGVSFVDTISWNCTTGALVSTDTCANPLPSGSVVGEAPTGAQVYWAPNANSASPGVVLNPGTYWVIGVDETGEYSKIWLTCESVFWVRSDTLQPSYRPPQNGQALPTRVVS